MRWMDLVKLLLEAARTIYPIYKDWRESRQKKKPASDVEDRKRTKLL